MNFTNLKILLLIFIFFYFAFKNFRNDNRFLVIKLLFLGKIIKDNDIMFLI